MAQTYRDPTFDEVARREAHAQRDLQVKTDQATKNAAWKNSPEYRRLKRQKISRLVQQAMNGRR